MMVWNLPMRYSREHHHLTRSDIKRKLGFEKGPEDLKLPDMLGIVG